MRLEELRINSLVQIISSQEIALVEGITIEGNVAYRNIENNDTGVVNFKDLMGIPLLRRLLWENDFHWDDRREYGEVVCPQECYCTMLYDCAIAKSVKVLDVLQQKYVKIDAVAFRKCMYYHEVQMLCSVYGIALGIPKISQQVHDVIMNKVEEKRMHDEWRRQTEIRNAREEEWKRLSKQGVWNVKEKRMFFPYDR